VEADQEQEVRHFLPVVVLDVEPAEALPVAGTQFDVELSNGHRIQVQGGFDPNTRAALKNARVQSRKCFSISN